MDRRSAPRFSAVRPVQLILLGSQDRRVDVLLQDLSDGGAQLSSTCKLPVGAPVRLDIDDSLFLGEVMYCVADASGFRAGLRFDQCLGRVSDIRRMVNALLGPAPVMRPTSAVNPV